MHLTAPTATPLRERELRELPQVIHKNQRTHYGTPKIQDGGDPPSWIFTPKCKNAIFSKTKQFRATVSIDDL